MSKLRTDWFHGSQNSKSKTYPKCGIRHFEYRPDIILNITLDSDTLIVSGLRSFTKKFISWHRNVEIMNRLILWKIDFRYNTYPKFGIKHFENRPRYYFESNFRFQHVDSFRFVQLHLKKYILVWKCRDYEPLDFLETGLQDLIHIQNSESNILRIVPDVLNLTLDSDMLIVSDLRGFTKIFVS